MIAIHTVFIHTGLQCSLFTSFTIEIPCVMCIKWF